MDKISIVEKKGSNYILFELTGNLNSHTYADLQSQLLPHIRESELVLDLSHITQITSSGLGLLMVCYEEGEEFGHKLYLMSPSDSAKKAIESTGFFEYFSIIKSLTEVL